MGCRERLPELAKFTLSTRGAWDIIRRLQVNTRWHNGPGKPLNTEKTQVTGWPRLRVGMGHDTHRLEPGGPLRIGGVEIEHDQQMVGHSDADVLLHAVTDALLGAAALGDIGQLFPNTDPANRGRDSAEMLTRAWLKVQQAGWQIANLDCIVFAERPKMSPHKQTIQTRIAQLLGIEPEQVGLKAKTGEGVDAVGRQEAIQAQAVVLLVATTEDQQDRSRWKTE